MIIAIDGPAGSGKSTTARAVARRLGFFYLDTGAMYRAVALTFMRQGLEPISRHVEDALARFDLDMEPSSQGLRVTLAGEDVTDAIREEAVGAMASQVSRLPEVRERLVLEQRRLAREEEAAGGGVVLEGRDIGTVVFPDADLKLFLTADLSVRARRRAAQIQGNDSDRTRIQKEMAERDHRDTTREESPLQKAVDAVEIDTTDLNFQEQVARIVALAGERKRRRTAD
ncbi:MAG: (d)CMP kinase [Rhodothermales bacterium]|nr:(d)CMP kinase [Rhodothermales bacterium]MBO6781637.1 (d)CMP kinase [Rhodothermales bacterium]